MKKHLFLLIFILFLTISLYPAHIAHAKENVFSEIIHNTDGSYITIETVVNNPILDITNTRSSYSKTVSKTFTYYENDNEAAWDVVLTATFIYDNISSQCISSSATYHVYDSYWSCTSLLPGKAGNAAWANFTFVKKILFITYNTYTGSVSISCSADGTIS